MIGGDDCDSTSWITGEPTQFASLLQTKHIQEPSWLPEVPEATDIEEVTVVEDTPADLAQECTWQVAEGCQESFVYKGVLRSGCIDIDHPTPWCSNDKVHLGQWSICKYTCKSNGSKLNEHYNAYSRWIRVRWINRFIDDFPGNTATTPPPLEESLRPQDKCTAPLIRFASINDINAVKPIKLGRDEYFLADESSIAPPGADCGDSARNIHRSCSRYNQWNSMDRISLALGFTFTVFNADTGTPAHTDVRQGQLGTCYFLAAIASIAYRAPQVIAAMFVRRQYWKQGIISTKWLVNGVVSVIEVDKSIPARGVWPYFASPDPKSRAWWPAILEKAWSKIYGSYKATEGGWWEAAAGAITRAPTVTYFHSQVKADELWEVLRTASENKWPMGAMTQTSKFGLAAGHAYSVLEAWTHRQLGKLVRVRNPWHTNYYTGSVPNPTYGDDTGIFDMSFNEFHEAFVSTGVAKVMPTYDVTSMRVYQASGRITGAFEFGIQTSKWLAVSIVWPNHRMLCKMPHPSYVLAVRKRGEEKVFYPEQKTSSVNAVYVELPPDIGIGTFDVAVSADFPQNTFIHEVQLNVYAEHPVEITSDPQADYSTLMLGMVGPVVKESPCEVATIASRGLWKVNKDSLVNGIPTYHSWDGKSFAYYVGSADKWFMIGNEYLDSVKKGRLWSFGKASREDFMCGCFDSPIGVRGFRGVGCNQVKAPSYKYSNVRCDTNVPYKSLVQSFCPLTCNVNICTNRFVFR